MDKFSRPINEKGFKKSTWPPKNFMEYNPLHFRFERVYHMLITNITLSAHRNTFRDVPGEF